MSNLGSEWFNWCAFAVSIVSCVPPEQAFYMMEEGKKSRTSITEEDNLDMLKLISEGTTYREVAEAYGVTIDAVFKRVKRMKARCSKDLQH